MSAMQELARKRNWLKYRLFGVNIPNHSLNHPYTETELESIKRIQDELRFLKKNFNFNSRILGLNVKKRCFCGKCISETEDYCNSHK